MYRIDVVDMQVVNDYADVLASQLKPLVDSYLGGQVLIVPIKGGNISVAVNQGSITHQILTYLSDLNNLKAFLKIDVKTQYKWVRHLQETNYPDDFIFKKLGIGTYKSNINGAPQFIDHFNEIMYDIFVTHGYEALIDTSTFISNTHIEVCPYCGNDKVIESRRSKNEIDHFLPKRKYPVFALCYYNLIPSCNYCNKSDHKGQLSPIDEFRKGLVVWNPYVFKPKTIRFHLKIANTNIFEPNNFDVLVGFADKRLLDGYDRFFDICDRYASNRQYAAEDYQRLMDFRADHFYDEMNVNQEWLKRAYRAVTGYIPNSNSPYQKERHFMRRDIFIQLTKLRKPGNYYVKGSGDNTVSLE